MSIIVRPTYLNHITTRLNRGMMIILVGQRRVGKSYMLRQLETWLKDNVDSPNVVYINKELQSFRYITTAEELYDYSIERLPEGVTIISSLMRYRIYLTMKMPCGVFMPRSGVR